jgi:hypothetical protein
MSGQINRRSFPTDTNVPARTITEVRLHNNTHPSDFRVPLPRTKEAIARGCTCPRQPNWPTVTFASDCPLHFMRVRQQGGRDDHCLILNLFRD